ncbi:MAG: protein translocase subunit SecF [Nitrospirae bacterium CG_4_10_14_0_8_um_filter_41_23]|nr:MAG: protein translocase subunit SecF [Nitrospirae bacterium CG11_big_fil_rev_8_21_14_0_20_41_14]PIV41736.1 MAG: protein translocase subunit SecF [Nitrospirae bacterium CG02_land_8_20_14_3_00_41_53]PIW86370.1 MAG: protein translocase subunit SecF [Nitrospirae bacterium CG_4_8_14_3_um_filter_41_47]PIY86482.1 MAG: protein translocase subunit SecF [Nitrospirae bacterium CG_4_10_14_0_8_um_filter_41_23]PJA79693.1 MAG: protein translocase subunit SecF [Nitrospirae bacterium CG_4_9_14_3_um_filter_4
MIELIKNPNIDFLGKRYIAFVFSGILSIIGIIAMVQIATGRANLGIDFAGGTAIQFKFENPVALHDVRLALESGGFKDFDLQDLPSVNKILIRVKKSEQELGKGSETITSILSQKFPENKYVVDSTTVIGPKVGGRLKADAAKAVAFAVIGILVYVAFRFQFKFGVGATIATFHDVLAVLGLFYIMGKEINLILVTALLTIAGYSLTDTVVVFDRIRENLKLRQRESIEAVMNSSVNEVLSRTIITSTTVLFTSIALFFFGGEVLHDFSLAMIMGVIVGTYSSIFVASPVVLIWGGKRPFAKK